MKEIPIKSTCHACSGKGFLATGETFTLAGRTRPLLNRCQEPPHVGFRSM